jgi:3-deoxy-D-manno-octulosonate 8-phosphate phosphatase (KDO 8-P phosphatase)
LLFFWLDVAKNQYFRASKQKALMNANEKSLQRITTFIFDYDGVMTDGTVYMDSNGDPLRTSNVKDGYALQLAGKLGFHLAVISGAVVTNITKRLNMLGVRDVFTGIPDKVVKLEEYMEQYGLKPEEIVYVGDDIPDMKVMQRVGIAACPADAAPEIRRICQFVSERPGGHGCVRDIIEQTLKAQGKWMSAEAFSW